MATKDGFESLYGFAPGAVTLDNWRQAPFSRWSFHNVDRLIACATVPCTGECADEPLATGGDWLARVLAPRDPTLLADLHTDALVVVKSGAFVVEHHAPTMPDTSRHLAFSVSKSLTGMLAGIVEDAGLLSPGRPVRDYVPELRGAAYGDCPVRDLLDMRAAVTFDEAYLDRRGDFARYRRAMGWDPAPPGEATEPMLAFLASMRSGPRPRGGAHHYVSPNVDVLGVVVERAAGARFADLLSELLWAPLGAHRDALVTVDEAGTARASGGICATARDLARLGMLLAREGEAGGRQVVPASWVHDMRRRGDLATWSASDTLGFPPGGRYRSLWYQTANPGGAFFALGIHGQWLYVDPARETVVVKLSSQPLPVDDDQDRASLALFDALAAAPGP